VTVRDGQDGDEDPPTHVRASSCEVRRGRIIRIDL
jgi:hypothetical protein